MPRRAPKPCRQTGCPHLTEDGWCTEHWKAKESRYQHQRGTAAQRGYDSHWGAYSRTYRLDHPNCVKCGAPTTQVDHITPVKGPRDPLFWDPTNHQALCTPCHSRKTVAEDHRGIGKREVQETVFADRPNGNTGLPRSWFQRS